MNRGTASALVASVLLSTSVSFAAPTLTDIGALPGTTSVHPSSLSADGLVATGYCTNASTGVDRAFRWTGGVMQDLGALNGGDSFGYGISGNGSTVVGQSPDFGLSGFRWTQGGGMQNLGILPGGCCGADAYAANSDGTVVVGTSGVDEFTQHAFRWVSGSGMTDLGAIGATHSAARGVSGDGTVVCGWSGLHAFRWTSGTGMQSLGLLPDGILAVAMAVSADGSTIVGYCQIPRGPGNVTNHGFRWTSGGGMQDLGVAPLTGASAIYNVNANGTAAVGSTGTGGVSNRALYWTPATGMVDLNVFLPQLGLDLTGWILTGSGGISADGRTIYGGGTFNGAQRGWHITGLPPVCPGPHTGDMNADGVTNGRDVKGFTDAVLAGSTSTSDTCPGDFSLSGVMDIADVAGFVAVLTN